jgi:hypothetical protein
MSLARTARKSIVVVGMGISFVPVDASSHPARSVVGVLKYGLACRSRECVLRQSDEAAPPACIRRGASGLWRER